MGCDLDSLGRSSQALRVLLPADLVGREMCPHSDAAAPVCSALLRARLCWQFRLHRVTGVFPVVRSLTVMGTSPHETGW